MMQRVRVMAKFDVFLVLVKRKDDGEVYTDDLEYVCYCDDTYKNAHMSDATNELIQEEVNDSEDEVLFGSADVSIKDKVKLKITFKNKDCDTEEIEDLLDLILDKTDQTIH
jgi:hypothetical protein